MNSEVTMNDTSHEAVDVSVRATDIEQKAEEGRDLMHWDRARGDYLGLSKGRAANFAATTKRRNDILSTRQQHMPLPLKSNKLRNLKQRENKQYPTRFYARGGRLAES